MSTAGNIIPEVTIYHGDRVRCLQCKEVAFESFDTVNRSQNCIHLMRCCENLKERHNLYLVGKYKRFKFRNKTNLSGEE